MGRHGEQSHGTMERKTTEKSLDLRHLKQTTFSVSVLMFVWRLSEREMENLGFGVNVSRL